MGIYKPYKKITEENVKPPPENWSNEIRDFWWLVWDLPNSELIAWNLYKRKTEFEYYLSKKNINCNIISKL